jgi:hypothetical protein
LVTIHDGNRTADKTRFATLMYHAARKLFYRPIEIALAIGPLRLLLRQPLIDHGRIAIQHAALRQRLQHCLEHF